MEKGPGRRVCSLDVEPVQAEGRVEMGDESVGISALCLR